MIIRTLLLIALLTITLACNVQSIRRERMNRNQSDSQSAQVDSFLYYQQNTLNDNFLDSLKTENDTEQIVKVEVLPPPAPPPPTMKQIEGFRIQTFAGLDSVNGLIAASELREMTADTVYYFKENGLFKIQIGDIPYRNDADMKVMDLRKEGISNGWVVQRMINVPVDTVATTDTTADLNSELNLPFTIQILATTDLLKAKNVIAELESQFQTKAGYQQIDNLYKVFLGNFKTREEAEKLLKSVRSNGYKDAWLVKK